MDIQIRNFQVNKMDETIFTKPGLSNATKGLKAIANPVRLQILCIIVQKNECTVGDIVSNTGMSQSAISQHLAKMKLSKVLADRRDGNKVFYRLADSNYPKLIDTLCILFNKD